MIAAVLTEIMKLFQSLDCFIVSGKGNTKTILDILLAQRQFETVRIACQIQIDFESRRR